MGDYQRLQTEAEAEVPLNPSSSPRQDVHYYSKPSSFWHTVAFICSIAFCVSVVVLFIWGLPCDLSPCQTLTSSSVSWDKTLYGLELKGRMHLVAGNIITILRSARWGKQNKFPQNGGGVIALNGKTGEELYWITMTVQPKFLDCSMSDLMNGNVKSCVIIGESGYLSAFNPISGIIIWKLDTKNVEDAPRPVDIDVPLVVPDMDSDGHSDFVTLSRFSLGHHRLAFISGRTGLMIKEPLLSVDCNQVNGLKFARDRSSLMYTCSNQFGSKTVEYPIKSRTGGRVLVPDEEFNRFVQGNSSSGEHNIIVNNSGSCPDNCYASANITDNRNRSIWSCKTDRAYAMHPLPLRFKHSITGFLFKLWHWNALEVDFLQSTVCPVNSKPPKSKTGVKIQSIQERILMITFNSGNFSVLNASQTDIIQLCCDNECQPHLSFQTQSALIADLNDDGSQDLISYFVTYKPDSSSWQHDKSITLEKWTLESRIKVVRLEAELPKFYESILNQ